MGRQVFIIAGPLADRPSLPEASRAEIFSS